MVGGRLPAVCQHKSLQGLNPWINSESQRLHLVCICATFQARLISDNHGCAPFSRALCQAIPRHVPKVVEQLNPTLSSVYDAQRIVVAAFFSEVWKACVVYLVTVVSTYLLSSC